MSRESRRADACKQIAVFCPNWVGDLVMATPALRALRTQYPRAKVTAILRPNLAEVLTGLTLCDDTIYHEPRPRRGALKICQGRRVLRGLGLASELRSREFDLAVLFPNSFRSAFWAFVSGAQRRVGMDRYGRGLLLTDRVKPAADDEPTPAIDDYLRVVKHLGCKTLTRNMELAVAPRDEKAIRALWQRHGGTAGYVCLNPGGAFGGSKHWPVTSFAELALRIATELDKKVLVLCGPAERSDAREIAALAHHKNVISLADIEPSIGLTKAAIAHSDLLVTTDSGPRHFAPPFGVPVVTVFGATHPQWSETYYDRALHLQLEMDCGPCQMRACPLLHHHCMRNLTPGWVFKAAASQLERYQKRKAA